jgi:integrase
MTPYKRGSRWWGRVTGERVPLGEDVRTRAQADAREAELKVRAARQHHGLEPLHRNPQKHTVASLMVWRFARIVKTRSGVEVKRTMTKHVVGAFAALPLDQVTTAAVNVWLDERQAEEGIANATVNRLRAYLMAAFSDAISRGLYLGANPVTGTEKRDEDRQAPRPLPAHLVEVLIANAPNAQWRRIITLAAFTGMRRSEIARLKWRDVDADRRIITVRATKASRDRLVPMHDRVVAVIEEMKRDGAVVIDRKGWDKSAEIVRHALERADIVDEEACFKALRSAWATQWVDCGAPPPLVEWVGWGPRSNSVMQRHYLTYPVATLHAEMKKLSWPSSSTNVLALPAKERA